MEEWFKHKYGYVNIDDDFIYFTNSGNWSETKALEEKSAHHKTNPKKTNANFFLFGLIIIGLLLFMKFKFNIIIVIFSVLAFSAYKSMKTDLGPSYKVNKSKLISIDFQENKADVTFYNIEGDEECETLYGIEAKGIEILKRLIAV